MSAHIEARKLSVSYPRKGQEPLRVLRELDLQIQQGENVGIAGPSGSGKSTLSRALLGLLPYEGEVLLKGERLPLRKRSVAQRREMQMIFQDPFASLNPRMSVGQCLEEPLWVHQRMPKEERRAELSSWLDRVGLPRDSRDRYPHEFSGGQRQRIAIARALILKPAFVIADEAVSALDVSVQAQILNLLMDLRRDLGLTMMFISHDHDVLRHSCDRIVELEVANNMDEAD